LIGYPPLRRSCKELAGHISDGIPEQKAVGNVITIDYDAAGQ